MSAPPGDAGERARELMREAQEACGIYHTGTVGKIIALVQSERTAAASQARQETIEECARKHDGWKAKLTEELEHWRQEGNHTAEAIVSARISTHEASANDLRALATPQESAS